jgi:hypothetical protein
MAAVASEGWSELSVAVAQARAKSPDPRHALTEIGLAYVIFARENPALYRLMYDTACDREDMPEHAKDESSGWTQVRGALVDIGVDETDELGLQLGTIAAWCAAHGVAEMAAFKEFEPIKKALGGEEAFYRAILDHLGIYARHARHTAA